MSRGKIPIKAAKQLSEKYDCPMVVIFGIESNGERFSVTTYGASRALCRYAADMGNKIAEAIFKGKIVPAQEEPVDLPNEPMIFESR